jgi:hypothetical protein
MKSIRPKPFDVASLKLSPEEGFVLSRVDGPLTLRELVALTGIQDDMRVVEIVGRLASQGAIDLDLEAHLQAVAEIRSSRPPEPEPEPLMELEELGPADEAPLDELEEIGPVEEPASEVRLVADPVDDDLLEPEPASEQMEVEPSAEVDEAEEERVLENERTYRKLYESVYRPMERDGRVAAALTAEGSHHLALCLDPDPQVIHAVCSNPNVGLDHARAIAQNHRTQAGLEICARRNEFLSDAMVQRRMLRNPQLPDTILRRIIHPKLLMDVYRIAIDREIPERSRVKTRELLRKKWMLASADERAALLIKTEGRCLILLIGCGIDAHTCQILCGKTTYGVLFVQNLARFSATPPQLLVHLLKQPAVRRNLGLRKMILQHHNIPSEVKRSF